MEIERMVVPIEWKATDDDHIMEGWASTFGNVDLGGDVVMPGAFRKSVETIKNNGGIPLLADHVAMTASVLGTIYDADEVTRGGPTGSGGLKVKARISRAPSAEDTRTKMLEGHLNKMSIGYEAMDYAFEDREDGQRVRLLKDIKLWESSVVVFPMNPAAIVSRVKSLLGYIPDDQRKALVDSLADAEAFVKGAAPVHHTITTEESWDAGENVTRLGSPVALGVARRMFALIHEDQAEGGKVPKGACALPHHIVSADGVPGAANMPAVRNALARLDQTQGWSDDEKAAAQRHLRAHLDDAQASTDPDLTGSGKVDDTMSTPAGGEPAAPVASGGEEGKTDPVLPGTPGEGVKPPGEDAAKGGWDRWASAAVLHGNDPDAITDPADRAGMTTRMDLISEEIERMVEADDAREKADRLAPRLRGSTWDEARAG